MRVLRSALGGLVVMAALIFLPAWTLNYWQGWAFIATFTLCTLLITVYLAKYDPKLLENRMSAGPQAEKETSQKVIMAFAMIAFFALLIFPALDYRFRWSPVPWYISIAGDLFIILSYAGIWLVFRENSYGASTIKVDEGQKVISTGPYALVRHPMYAAAIPMAAGVPLALGSWWGVFGVVPFVAVLALRLLDEERYLHKNLPGYTEYTQKVKYRLLPYIW